MALNGLIIIIICLALRLIKRLMREQSIAWALLSIAYFVGVHVGVVMLVYGLWR